MIAVADLSAISPNAPGTVVGRVAAPDPAAAVNVDLSRYEIAGVHSSLQGATGGTLDVVLQFSPDCGVTWVDWMRFAQLAAGDPITRSVVAPHKPTAYSATTVPLAGPGAAMIPVHPGDRLRVVFVAGAGTSAGAMQTIKVYGVERAGR